MKFIRVLKATDNFIQQQYELMKEHNWKCTLDEVKEAIDICDIRPNSKYNLPDIAKFMIGHDGGYIPFQNVLEEIRGGHESKYLGKYSGSELAEMIEEKLDKVWDMYYADNRNDDDLPDIKIYIQAAKEQLEDINPDSTYLVKLLYAAGNSDVEDFYDYLEVDE